MKTKNIFKAFALIIPLLIACENKEITFDDFDYQTVYFATQYPIRTVVLGEDLFVDNRLDNEHKVEIKATMGGVYKNQRNIVIDIVVDETLCENLEFDFSGTRFPLIAMPTDYYNLLSDQIVIPAGSVLGGVLVQLTDAFFEDPASLENTYVIPLRMTKVEGADSILQGNPVVENPDRRVDSDWTARPRDFTLYAIKYINKWDGIYVRRGTDIVTGEIESLPIDTTIVRRKEYVEDDEVVNVSTTSYTSVRLPITLHFNNETYNHTLDITFSEDDNFVISGGDGSYVIEGTGKFVSNGEKNSIGGRDRSAFYLDYNVNFPDHSLNFATKDTLVLRDRGVAPEYFNVVVN